MGSGDPTTSAQVGSMREGAAFPPAKQTIQVSVPSLLQLSNPKHERICPPFSIHHVITDIPGKCILVKHNLTTHPQAGCHSSGSTELERIIFRKVWGPSIYEELREPSAAADEILDHLVPLSRSAGEVGAPADMLPWLRLICPTQAIFEV